MDNMSVKTINITAFIVKSKSEDGYTVFMDGKGGPVVSAPTEEEAKKKFNEALNLSCAITNLLTFNEAVKAQEEAMKKFVKESAPKKVEINYVDLPSLQYAD